MTSLCFWVENLLLTLLAIKATRRRAFGRMLVAFSTLACKDYMGPRWFVHDFSLYISFITTVACDPCETDPLGPDGGNKHFGLRNPLMIYNRCHNNSFNA